MLELHPCIPYSKLPVNTFLTMISVPISRGGLSFQRTHVTDPPSQAFLGEGGQFNIGQVQPGAMLWGMMQFKFLPYGACFGRLKGLIQGRNVMRVQVVAHKNDLFRFREVFIHKSLDFLRPIRLASVLTDAYASSDFQGCREQKAAACAVPDILTVNPLRMVIFGHMDLLTGIVMELYRLLVRPGVNFKHILNVGHERSILLKRDAPHLSQVRLIPVFLERGHLRVRYGGDNHQFHGSFRYESECPFSSAFRWHAAC